VHTVRIVKEWFAQHLEIEILDWPAKFPDLNLIENVWGIIANSWSTRHERTKAHLIAHAMDKWENLRHKSEYFAHLSGSIEQNLQQVVAWEGYWTDY